MVATPRDAATVVVLRDGDRGPEAYLLRRVAGMAFAGGMTVFPGGSVDPEDARSRDRWVGPDPQSWTGPLSADEPLACALVSAAVRELFEESGVLLAGPSEAEVVDVSAPAWEDERIGLESRRYSLVDVLERHHLLLRADLLRPWAHWVTPAEEPRRFDTRFFVAALPTGQATRDVGGEADRVSWMRPAAALESLRRKEMAMLPPTSQTLTEIAGYATVAEVMAAAVERDISPVLPRIVMSGDQARILLPGDAGYDL